MLMHLRYHKAGGQRRPAEYAGRRTAMEFIWLLVFVFLCLFCNEDMHVV